MNAQNLLDQLLKSGSSLLPNPLDNARTPGESTPGGNTLQTMLAGAGGGALAATAIGLLLGSGKARKIGARVVTYGGAAALGALAYKAYGNWQQQKGVSVAQTSPQTVDRLPAPAVEQHSRAILCALIAAAKADGHIDDRERQLIDAEIAKLTSDPAIERWFDQELRAPLDPARIARMADTPELGAEIYLASFLVADDQSFMERSYLEELARQLQLDPALKTELETQARAAASLG